jgi:hypothetical protein
VVRMRFEGNYAGHEAVGHGAPRDSASGNLKHNLKDPLFVFAVRMPYVAKMRVINSSHVPQ